MNSFLIAFIISSIAGLSTVIGTIPIFIKLDLKHINKFITFCLSFSMSIMLLISIIDLIPNSFFTLIKYNSYIISTFMLIACLILSLILVNIIDKLTNKYNANNDLFKVGVLNMIVLIIHNLPEGIVTFMSSYHEISLGIKLSIAIMLHNIPEGVGIAVPIYYATKSKKKAIKATLISAISEPIGAIIAFIFLKKYINDLLISIILIFVGSLMLCLALEKVFPKVVSYHEKKSQIYGSILALIFILSMLFFE